MKARLAPALALLVLLPVVFADAPDSRPEQARAAFADRDFVRGVSIFRALAAEHPDGDRADYCSMMVVRGLSLAGDDAGAAKAGEEFLGRYPGSAYLEKVAFLTARALLAQGRGADADDLMRASLDRLTGPAARARVAAWYLKAADRAFAGVASKGPFDPGTPPDYPRALRLYRLANATGLPAKLRPAVLLRTARAAVETKGYPVALEVLDDLDRMRGDAAPEPKAMLLRGRALIGLGRAEAARDVLDRLVATAPRSAEAPEALLLVDDPAHLERLVREYPDHPRAAFASLRAGRLLAKRGDVDAAVAAFDRTIERFPDASEAASAALDAAGALFAAGRYEEARGRYDAFLRRWPESADWAKARDQLTQAWFRQGADLLQQGKTDDAARIWNALRATYPLSPLAPRTLLEEAGKRAGTKETALLGELLTRYPGAPEAPTAALRMADRLSGRPGKIEEAVAAYKRVIDRYRGTPQAATAARQLAEMQKETLSIDLPAPRPLGKPPALVVKTRNLKTLSVRAWRIDPVAYFEKHASLANVDNVMVEVVAPDLKQSYTVPDYEDYRTIGGDLTLPVDGPGAWIVVVEGGNLRATGLLLVSDLTLITKESPRGVLAFVQRASDGSPVPGADVLVKAGTEEPHRAVTGQDGVAEIDFANPGGGVAVLAARDGAIAFTGFDALRRRVEGLETRVHLSTDRPIYRPGDTVHFRAVVRQAAGEHFETPSGKPYAVAVKDREGNTLLSDRGLLSEFGTMSGKVDLPADLPPGAYRIVLTFEKTEYASNVTVEAYRKPQIFLGVDPDRPVFVRGEEVRFAVTARYSFGRPLPDQEIPVVVSRVVPGSKPEVVLRKTVRTDEEGRAPLAIPTTPGPDMELEVRAELTDVTRRNYLAEVRIPVPAAAFGATLAVSRDRFFTGEPVHLTVRTADVLGNPVAAEGAIEVARGTGGNSFAEVATLAAKTGEDGKTEVDWTAKDPGQYRFRFVARDRNGTEVAASATAEVLQTVHRVVVRAGRASYRVGETGKLEIAAPRAGLTALLTFEGDEVYRHRVIPLAEARSEVSFDVTEKLWPDVRVRVALVDDGKLLTGEDRITVDQEIRVTVKADKADYQPGDPCRISIRTEDLTGKPVPAEVALAVVDQGIFVLHPDDTPALAATFRPPLRQDLVRTRSSVDFRYLGATAPISADLLAERERRQEQSKQEPSVNLAEKSLEDHNESDNDGPFEESAKGIGGGAGGAFGGRGGHRNLRAAGGGAAENLTEPRSEFRDTALWRASVVTGADGTATAEFSLPDDLTEWRITARAASHGNAFGGARASFTVSRPLVIRAALPRFLREGDELTAAAGIENGTADAIDANVKLSPAAGGDVRQRLSVPAHRELSVDWPLDAGKIGEHTYSARAGTSTLVEDAEERKLPTLPFGVSFRTGFAGISTAAGERTLDLPDATVPGSASLTLRISPSLLRTALDGVAELTSYPYGCTEQTVNRFLPALEAARAIRRLGLDAADALPELDRSAHDGALRLTYLQNSEGLWGWWRRGGSNAEMTAYALIGLGRAKAAGIDFSSQTLVRAARGLPKLLARTTDADERAFLLLGASWAWGPDYQTLAPAFADRARLGVSGLAWLALAYEPLGKSTQHDLLVSDLRARLSGASPGVETLGWALAALAGDDPTAADTRRIAVEIATRRQGRSFGTTRATGAAVIGLVRVAAAAGSANAATEVAVTLNGEEVHRETVGAGPLTGRVMKIPADRLKPGGNRVAVTGSGGTFFYTLTLSGVRRDTPPSSGPLSLARRLTLVPRGTGQSALWGDDLVKGRSAVREPDVEIVRTGEAVRVRLTVKNDGEERYLVVEEPLAAGFEPVPGSESGPFSEFVRRDDRVVFFLENAPKSVELSFVERSEAPGRVRIPPGTAYAMYRPDAVAYSTARGLTVADRSAKIDRDPTVGLSPADLLARAAAERDAHRYDDATRFVRALLDRYELVPTAKVRALELLAHVRSAAGDPRGAVDAYARMKAEVPSFDPTFDDQVFLAGEWRALGRHGEAVSAMEAAAGLEFAKDVRVPDALGPADSSGFLPALLDQYPMAPYTEAAWNALVARRATAAEAALKGGKEPPPADLDAMREFLARYPKSAAAPSVDFRLARLYLRAGRYAELEAAARRFSDRYPDSALKADADWFVAYALFAQARYADADQAARASLERTYRNAKGEKGPSSYRMNLLHLRAQVAHVEGRLDDAVKLYREVAPWSVDAREALALLTEKTFDVPAVTRVKPGDPAKLELKTKNLAQARLDLYPVDILVYFALRKDVSRVAGLDLDGLKPALSRDVSTEGAAHRERTVSADLGELAPGVYLVIGRAGGMERRGVLLVSGLDARIQRYPEGVRVLVTERATGAPVEGAYVKIAADGEIAGEGTTDARGYFQVSRPLSGRIAAVAKKGDRAALAD